MTEDQIQQLEQEEDAVFNKTLVEADDDCIADDAPILSCLITSISNSAIPCSVFWRSVAKHNLRLPEESDEQLIERLRQQAFDYHMEK